MTKVSLIGDSIRLGYEDAVRQNLGNLVEIWTPEGNCMHSMHHLCNLGWYLDQPARIIHFNFGLWDCRRLGSGLLENLVPVSLFVRNLDFLLNRVRSGTDARLVWATITPIVEERYRLCFASASDPARVAGDIAIYNTAAAPILSRYDVVVNDLHDLVSRHGSERLICDDGVHFTPEGCSILGQQVADVVRSQISLLN